MLAACSDGTDARGDGQAGVGGSQSGIPEADASARSRDGDAAAPMDAASALDPGAMLDASDGDTDSSRDAATAVDAHDANDAFDVSGGDANTDPGDDDQDSGADPGCVSPNVLFVFDESGSMEDAWGDATRLQGARAAVTAAVAAHAETLTAGALFFPTAACVPFLPPPLGGAVYPLSHAMQIDFRSGADFLQAWDEHRSALDVNQAIGTPLEEALDRADVGLSAASLPGTTRVVLITDGDGNCLADEASTGTPSDTPRNRASAWAAAGIETYAVSVAPTASAQLDEIAAGSGIRVERPVDSAALTALLYELLGPDCP